MSSRPRKRRQPGPRRPEGKRTWSVDDALREYEKLVGWLPGRDGRATTYLAYHRTIWITGYPRGDFAAGTMPGHKVLVASERHAQKRVRRDRGRIAAVRRPRRAPGSVSACEEVAAVDANRVLAAAERRGLAKTIAHRSTGTATWASRSERNGSGG